MDSDILLAFSVFQLTFLLLDIYILSMTGRDIARKGEYTWFGILILTHMVYLILNTVWTMQEYDWISVPRTVLTIICVISLWTVTLCPAFFYLFMVEKIRVQSFLSGRRSWLRLIPAAVTTMLIFSSPWTKIVFSLDEDGHIVHGPLYMLMVVVSTLYLLLVAGISLGNMLRARTTSKRHSNGAVFGSVLIILLFVVTDNMMTKASVLPAAVFAVIVVIFITMQESNINSDALTGMNNRRKADEYLSDRLVDVSGNDPLYLYMGDLNGFKKINDTYGHTEGDEALIRCSRALKRAISKYNGFAARFGGDEFLLSWRPGKGKGADPESLIHDVEAFMEEESSGKPYQLAMTMGYVICTDPGTPLNTYLKQADEMLYYRKKQAGVGR